MDLETGGQRGTVRRDTRGLADGQAALADEGAALEYLPGYAQQSLSQVLTVYLRHRLGRAGIGAGEVLHGGAGPAGVPQHRPALAAGFQVHPPLHGLPGPGGEAVLVRQGAALAGRQTIQHGADEAAPGGLAGFVGGIDQVQPRLQPETVAPQPPIGGLHLKNVQEEVPPL